MHERTKGIYLLLLAPEMLVLITTMFLFCTRISGTIIFVVFGMILIATGLSITHSNFIAICCVCAWCVCVTVKFRLNWIWWKVRLWEMLACMPTCTCMLEKVLQRLPYSGKLCDEFNLAASRVIKYELIKSTNNKTWYNCSNHVHTSISTHVKMLLYHYFK